MKLFILFLLVLLSSNVRVESFDKQVVLLPPSSMKKIKSLALDKNIDFLGLESNSKMMLARVTEKQRLLFHDLGVTYNVTQSFLENVTSFDGYLKPNQVRQRLESLAAKYPHFAKVLQFGSSVDGAKLVALEISNDVHSVQKEKPVVFFNGLHHARELMTTEIVVHIAETLLSFTEGDEETRAWLENFRIVVVPQVNPDGHALVHKGYAWWRKNTAGNPLMYGVDLNRNYPENWNACDGSSGIRSDDTYRGAKAASEPETQAMLKLFEMYKPIANISYHSFSEVILYPFGCAEQTNSAETLFHAVAESMRDSIVDDNGDAGTYKIGTAPDLLYNADGGDNDTHWLRFGTLSFAIEAGSSKQGFQPPYDVWRNLTVSRQSGGWKALLRQLHVGAVQAMVASSDNTTVTYSIEMNSASGPLKFVGSSQHPIPLRSANGFLFQNVLPEGSYSLKFYKNSILTKTIPFTTSHSTVDLGIIQL